MGMGWRLLRRKNLKSKLLVFVLFFVSLFYGEKISAENNFRPLLSARVEETVSDESATASSETSPTETTANLQSTTSEEPSNTGASSEEITGLDEKNEVKKLYFINNAMADIVNNTCSVAAERLIDLQNVTKDEIRQKAVDNKFYHALEERLKAF